MSYFKNRVNAFGFAFKGLFQAFKKEVHFQLQVNIAIVVIAAGFYFSISKTEWLVVLGFIAFVLSLELINSAIENLCDLYSTEQNPKIKYIKDVSAAAVLIASIIAAVAGLIIFIPYFN